MKYKDLKKMVEKAIEACNQGYILFNSEGEVTNLVLKTPFYEECIAEKLSDNHHAVMCVKGECSVFGKEYEEAYKELKNYKLVHPDNFISIEDLPSFSTQDNDAPFIPSSLDDKIKRKIEKDKLSLRDIIKNPNFLSKEELKIVKDTIEEESE